MIDNISGSAQKFFGDPKSKVNYLKNVNFYYVLLWAIDSRYWHDLFEYRFLFVEILILRKHNSKILQNVSMAYFLIFVISVSTLSYNRKIEKCFCATTLFLGYAHGLDRNWPCSETNRAIKTLWKRLWLNYLIPQVIYKWLDLVSADVYFVKWNNVVWWPFQLRIIIKSNNILVVIVVFENSC